MKKLRVLSLFAGVGGFDMAAHEVGMETVMACEIDRSARAVFRRHFPHAHIAHDVKHLFKKELNDHGPFDVLCAGFPCQDISVAGGRLGLDGARSGLFFRIMRLLPKFAVKPRWLVLENVGGLLSSNGGRDLGTVVSEMEKRGYWWAYRRTDLQFFGCAQRRQRVFIVGNLGGWAGPAEVLFEPEGRPWDSPPRRKQGAHVAALTSNGVGTCGADDNQAQAGHLIAAPLTNSPYADNEAQHTKLVVQPECITGNITHALRAEGADASEDGTGRGTPIVIGFHNRQDPDVSGDVSHPLGARDNGMAVAIQGIGKRTGKSTTDKSIGIGVSEPGAPMYTLQGGERHAVAFALRGRDEGAQAEPSGDKAVALRASQGGGDKQFVATPLEVRRLMPIECERLMGWADDWTALGIDDDSLKVTMSDGERYKQCGNGVSKPQAKFVLGRIAMVEAR